MDLSKVPIVKLDHDSYDARSFILEFSGVPLTQGNAHRYFACKKLLSAADRGIVEKHFDETSLLLVKYPDIRNPLLDVLQRLTGVYL